MCADAVAAQGASSPRTHIRNAGCAAWSACYALRRCNISCKCRLATQRQAAPRRGYADELTLYSRRKNHNICGAPRVPRPKKQYVSRAYAERQRCRWDVSLICRAVQCAAVRVVDVDRPGSGARSGGYRGRHFKCWFVFSPARVCDE